MSDSVKQGGLSRREFLRLSAAGTCLPLVHPWFRARAARPSPTSGNKLFWVTEIPDEPFIDGDNLHAGFERLLTLMGQGNLKFYRSQQDNVLSGISGLIARDDVVLIKVNAQWKYRGCTNSDLVRGVIQRILDHPDGFAGEVVIIENGQGRGSLKCDTTGGTTYSNNAIHANANDESHSFVYLADTVFQDSPVSAVLLDPIRGNFIAAGNHVANGYRRFENVSYPCFTTPGGRRVELLEGIWTGSGYRQNLKLINIPVLKHHDTGGSEITASLKHVYGILSMSDGQSGFRHYSGLGETCGKMVVSVRTPVLNLIDAIWVSHASLKGYPANTTFRANQLLASQDPVALDFWAAKYILYPIDYNSRHHPKFPGINDWLTDAAALINNRGGLYDPYSGIQVSQVAMTEEKLQVFKASCAAPDPVFQKISPQSKGARVTL